MLSIILSVFGSALGNPFGRAALAALGLIFSYNIAYYRGVWSVDVKGIERRAADARDLVWQKKLSDQERAAQAAVDAAIAERDATPDPVDATVASLCSRDRDCKAD